jgi:HemY protein
MNQVLSDAKLEDLEVQTAEARLRAASEQGPAPLEAIWRGFTREQKRLPAVIALYARSLIRTGQAEQAEQLLRNRLDKDKDWDPRLLNVYAELDLEPATQVLAVTERWLKDHPEDPDLLYAAGSQALRGEQLGSARSYLEASVSRSERPETLRLLGDVYDRLGESGRARDSYRRALTKMLGEVPVHPVLPVAVEQPAHSLPPTPVEPAVQTTVSS